MKYISAFDGKTLHDGSNRWFRGTVPATKKAETEVVSMANGSLFDPNYGTGSTMKPQPFTAQFFMRFATKAEAETERADIEAKLGDNGVLTASFDSGAAAETCTATLDNAQFYENRNGFSMKVVLRFIPFDDFS